VADKATKTIAKSLTSEQVKAITLEIEKRFAKWLTKWLTGRSIEIVKAIAQR
jgi:hypothetical protein